jgi:hypothetical protein
VTGPLVSVEPLGSDLYRVRVGAATEHEVTATAAVLARVARDGETPEATLARAFAFLLDREPAQSILRRFALEDIARYFPEFWDVMNA